MTNGEVRAELKKLFDQQSAKIEDLELELAGVREDYADLEKEFNSPDLDLEIGHAHVQVFVQPMTGSLHHSVIRDLERRLMAKEPEFESEYQAVYNAKHPEIKKRRATVESIEYHG